MALINNRTINVVIGLEFVLKKDESLWLPDPKTILESRNAMASFQTHESHQIYLYLCVHMVEKEQQIRFHFSYSFERRPYIDQWLTECLRFDVKPKHMFIYSFYFGTIFSSLPLVRCVYLLRFIIYSILSFVCDLIAFVHTHVLLIRLLFFYALIVCVCTRALRTEPFKKYAVNFWAFV